MFPIRDNNPTTSTAYLTIALIILNAVIFLYEVSRPGDGMHRLTWKYGYLPAELLHGSDHVHREMTAAQRQMRPTLVRDPRTGRIVLLPPTRLPIAEAAALPAWINIFTGMFLHGGWWHLIGNMFYLWIFGRSVEDRLGPLLFIVFYLGTGLVGNLAHTFFDPGLVPLIGASGAIAGVMGAYVLLFPRARILAIVPIGFYPSTWSLPAWVFLGFYFLIQNLFPATFGAAGGNVAHWAHIGGFLSGLALIYAFPHRPTPPPPPPRDSEENHPEVDDADFVL